MGRFEKGHPGYNKKANGGSLKKGLVPWNKGKTKEDLPQLSNSGVKKGNIPWIKGKKHSKETIDKYVEQRAGSKSYHWKDGRSSIPGYLNWLKNQYKARKKNAEGSHTFKDWLFLKEKFNNTCLCCGRVEPEIKLTEDHILPITKGGSDYIDNIQPLCQSCNSHKNVKTTSYKNTGFGMFQKN